VGFKAITDTNTENRDKTELSIDTLHQLLRDHTDLTHDEIEAAVQDKLDEYFITSEVAAYCLVCHDHEINHNQELGREVDTDLRIRHLEPGVTINELTVEIADITDIRTFDSGSRVQNLIVTDLDGEATTQLGVWNEDIEALEAVAVGDRLRIVNGYADNPDDPKDNYCLSRWGYPEIKLRKEDGQLLRVTDRETERLL